MKGIYDVGKAWETRRYLSDYYRWTGYRPKYPYRSGSYDILRASGGLVSSVGLSYGGMYSYLNRGYQEQDNFPIVMYG